MMKQFIVVIFTVLLLLPGSVRGEEYYTDNLVIVMDCSGSMNGNKIVQAKSALKEVLKRIPSTTHVGLLSFGQQSGWQYPLGPRNDAELIRAIDRLYTGGSTPLGEYMKIAADQLLEQKEKQFGYGTYRLLVITDGEASDQDKVDRFTPEIMTRGITVDTIGVFMNRQHSLANTVHSYRSANDTASLTKAITEVLAEIGGQQDGTASAEAFEMIAGLPDNFVGEAIKVLASASVIPITGNIRVQQPAKKAIINQQTPKTPKQTQKSQGSSNTFMYAFGAIFAVVIIASFLKGK